MKNLFNIKCNCFKKANTFLFVFLLTTFSSIGQIKFYANTNTRSVPLNQNFQLNYIVENGQATQLTAGDMKDFQVLSGPNTSQNMQWINGQVSQSVTYSFIVKPKREGSFTIGKGVAKIEGVKIESNEVSISVTAPVKEDPRQQQRSNSPFGFDPFSDPFFNDDDAFDPFQQIQRQLQQQQQQQQQRTPSPQQAPITSKGNIDKEIRGNVFTKLIVDRNNVFIGEKVTAVLKIYARMNFGNVAVTKAPTFNGFWSQEIKIPQDQKPQVEVINGEQFYVFDLMKYNLFPQKSGVLQITPAELNMMVQAQISRQPRNLMEQIFGSTQIENIPYKPSSNGSSVNVKELPEAGKPADFNGAVGKFQYETNISTKEAKTDDAITLHAKIAGTGNLNLVEPPKSIAPEGFEMYDPKTKENISQTVGGTSGTKEYDYLMIPRMPGDYKIPATKFSYFDPSAGKYFTISSPEYALHITGEPSKTQPISSNTAETSKQDVIPLGKDIRYIKTTSTFENEKPSFMGSWAFGGLYAIPFLALGALTFWKKRNEDFAADITGTKQKRATKMAKKRLAIAENLMKSNSRIPFYEEISKSLWGYLSDKLSIEQSQLYKDNVEEKLVEKSVSPATIAVLHKTLQTCEQALYTPMSHQDELKNSYLNAIDLITKFEEEIKL